MTHTSWRDDYTRIVKGRAMAYDERDGAFHTDMPFENVYGNGGLLTTVGDLLQWNENFASPVVGDAAFVDGAAASRDAFNDGRPHIYAFGLCVRDYRGVREVSHSGSTAGYRAFSRAIPTSTRRSPCCATSRTPTPRSSPHQVADIYVKNLKPAMRYEADRGAARRSRRSLSQHRRWRRRVTVRRRAKRAREQNVGVRRPARATATDEARRGRDVRTRGTHAAPTHGAAARPTSARTKRRGRNGADRRRSRRTSWC